MKRGITSIGDDRNLVRGKLIGAISRFNVAEEGVYTRHPSLKRRVKAGNRRATEQSAFIKRVL